MIVKTPERQRQHPIQWQKRELGLQPKLWEEERQRRTSFAVSKGSLFWLERFKATRAAGAWCRSFKGRVLAQVRGIWKVHSGSWGERVTGFCNCHWKLLNVGVSETPLVSNDLASIVTVIGFKWNSHNVNEWFISCMYSYTPEFPTINYFQTKHSLFYPVIVFFAMML